MVLDIFVVRDHKHYSLYYLILQIVFWLTHISRLIILYSIFIAEDIEVAVPQQAVSDDVQVPLQDISALVGEHEELESIPKQSIIGIAVCNFHVVLILTMQ